MSVISCLRATISPLTAWCTSRQAAMKIELYTDTKNPSVEKKLEDALDKRRIFYNKSEVWIASEKLYEVLYQFDMEVVYDAEEE